MGGTHTENKAIKGGEREMVGRRGGGGGGGEASDVWTGT